jgi:hypothetical protein
LKIPKHSQTSRRNDRAPLRPLDWQERVGHFKIGCICQSAAIFIYPKGALPKNSPKNRTEAPHATILVTAYPAVNVLKAVTVAIFKNSSPPQIHNNLPLEPYLTVHRSLPKTDAPEN